MAMDKEKLLAYFQAHYLSRQEVLFKLPLSIPIDSFWPELLKRRKAQAQLLPLYNASGMPYWYVLTDRMIAASERLCEEAISQDTAFDPYRAGMTSAMTEEMFFTSFVEGAQIPLQEAMDFLQRGTEPESIQEQMIWNNRRAWAEMIKTLYRPLDGNFVKGLAFILTEEMDDCAEDYRQTDQHPIAAMNNESYDVPPAYSLPDRMNEYYDFLQKPDIHPLIKAAAAQAYLLVTRPFPEGNERLSRMMSSAVLLRSGYDFFRDISISSVIARENYRYYKCMCEIIRSENGGDLTYFIQYYLELLVRALDMRNERQRKREQEAREREQEALRQEREMARKPLTAVVQPGDEDVDWDAPDIVDGTPLPKSPAPANDEPADAEDVDTADPESPFVNTQSRVMPPVPLMEQDKFLQAVSKLKHSRYPGIRGMPDKVKQMIEAGLLQFSVGQWAEITGIDMKKADYECRYMYEKGWMTRAKEDKRFIYALRIRTDTGAVPAALVNRLNDLSSPEASEKQQRIAGILLRLYEKGIYSFSVTELEKEVHLSRIICANMLRSAFNFGLLNREPDSRNIGHYRYSFNQKPVKDIRSDGLSPGQLSVLTYLYISFRNHYFSIEEGAKACHLHDSGFKFHVQNLAERGILTTERKTAKVCVYALATNPLKNPECFIYEDTAKHRQTSSIPSTEPIPMAAASA